jgi:hypothetical protein
MFPQRSAAPTVATFSATTAGKEDGGDRTPHGTARPSPGPISRILADEARASRELERYAVVDGPSWLARWLRLWQSVLRLALRHLAEDDEGAARACIGAQPFADRRVAG